MYIVATSATFSAAHHLRNYRGGCERTHGHNWKVDVHVAGDEPGKDGMIIDFSILKRKTNKILEALDHRDLNTIPYFKKHNPTAENLAKYIYDGLDTILKRYRLNTISVTVWESEDSRASYTRNRA